MGELHPRVGNCLSDKVYHPKRTFALLIVYCALWGKNGAPPSVNTMQFFYRLLESQKVKNKKLKRLRNELRIEMWCIHYVCRGQSPYRNFLSKQYRIRSTDVVVAAFEISELCGSHIGAALGSSGFLVHCAVTIGNQSPQNSTPVSRKNFVLHRAYRAFHTVCSQCVPCNFMDGHCAFCEQQRIFLHKHLVQFQS